MKNRSILRQFGLIFVVTFATIFVLLRSDLVSRLAYSVEKGRLEALREAMPSSEQVAQASLPARNVARLVMPAVVSIKTEAPPSRTLVDHLLERLGDPADESDTKGHPGGADEMRRRLEEHIGRRGSIGSGFVIDADEGLLLTNHHVIEGAEAIHVQLADGREYDARVVATDPETDLALIVIDADRLHQIELADSDQVRVGDDVFALGSPFGLAGSVSRGIISGRGRTSRIPMRNVVYEGFLQTDAVINPGNSGGPLVNMRGEVIGVNTAIASQTGYYDGVGFAIPSSRVSDVLPALRRGEKVKRGFLGVLPVAVVDAPDVAAELGWEESYGIMVRTVVPDSSAAAAGLEVGDVILRINGTRQEEIVAFREYLAAIAPGHTISLEVWRGEHTLTLEATLGDRARR